MVGGGAIVGAGAMRACGLDGAERASTAGLEGIAVSASGGDGGVP